MATFTWPVHVGVTLVKEPRVRTATFGDGYQQRVGDGINTIARQWQIEVVGYRATVEAAEAFLTARAGVESFDWQPTSGAAGKWVCRTWQARFDKRAAMLTATFEEVFGD